MRLVVGLLSFVAMWGQSLHVPASRADQSGEGSFSLLLESPDGKAPVAMQWQLLVPSMFRIGDADVKPGKAALASGKSVVCGAGGQKPGTESGVRYTCILAGGVNRISNGPVAEVHYRVEAGVHVRRGQVTIEKVVGVSLDLRSTAMGGATAMITLR